jgi:hypothetical protein
MADKLTPGQARALARPLDDLTLAQVLATGATRAELAEALGWVDNDDAMLNEGRPIPTGRVAQLVELLKARDEEELPVK